MTDRNLHTMVWVLAVIVALVAGLRIGPHLDVIKLPLYVVAPELQPSLVCADTLSALDLEALRYGLQKFQLLGPRQK